ncbi:TonB-dependent receptor [Rosettibacter firmus]|uniref:TonB-dependent receptor n=1 Tax=Rosettibacter firmus TaxID=3111522 RepID=UPI00336C16C4
MKKLILIIFILITEAIAQTYFQGKVVTKDGRPIFNANITVVGKPYGTTSDENGIFKLNYPLKTGDLISISCIGYQTKTIKYESSLNFLIINLNELSYISETVVVTGTRSIKKLKDTPVKTELISEKEIKNCGYLSLKEALFEQTGIGIIDNHGSGLQIQGLDPDYTLILIDGDPVIGRTAGTIDLSRFDVANLKQIEIVKGPSSSLYGSEALAGVVNLITAFPDESQRFALFGRIGTHDSYQINADIFKSNKKIKLALFSNIRGSDGFDIVPETISKTIPEYHNFLINPKFEYRFNESNFVRFNMRYSNENQNNFAEITENNQIVKLKVKDRLRDVNFSILYSGSISNLYKHQLRFYVTNYYTESLLSYQTGGEPYEYSQFDQYYYKGEYSANFIIDRKNLISFGAGYVKEVVHADRVDKDIDEINSSFVFLQHEWIPSRYIDIVGGFRYDYNNKYSSRLSPKITTLLKPCGFLTLNLSIGSGFKAPTLQQLYLNFTNPQVGYSVFGAAKFSNYLNKLINEGQIDKILLNPSNISKLNAESSLSLNFSIEYEPSSSYLISLNFFRNNIRDLIDAIPVALKKNGQGVYTYVNLNKIYTQGIESEIKIKFFNNINISFGYQFLDAIDQVVLERIRAGDYFKLTDSGRLKKITESDYGGLFNRSKHTGNIKLNYENETLGLFARLTCIVKGKYGYYDRNGNGILDDKSEYAPGFSLWNFVFNKVINSHFAIQLRIENILNKKLSGQNLNLPGRIIYAGISINY